MVIKRRYLLPNKEMHPSPPCSFDVGGFNNFSTFGGHSRLLTSQTFRMITATSAVRPLHSSHLGDSGITNLSNGIGWEMVKWKIQVKSQQNKVQNQKRKVFFLLACVLTSDTSFDLP